MRRLIMVLVGALVAMPLWAQAPDRLLPQKKRITDEALARDRALIQSWLARAESLPSTPGDAYARARAIALLQFVATEYDRANRSPVLDTSFVHAVAIVNQVGGGGTWYEQVAPPAGVEEVAPGLWARLDSLHAADTNRCAAAPIASAQVKLLLAVEEHRTGGKACSEPVVREVEALIAEIERLLAACAPTAEAAAAPVPEPEAEPEATPEPEPEAISAPGVVHFAFNKATLSPATRVVLDSLVARLRAVPDAEIQLAGYADPQGNAAYNRQLSARRGEAVRKYLVAHGVDPARISVTPMGATTPVKGGGSRLERHALDRRVEIQVRPRSNVRWEPYAQQADLQVTDERRRAAGRSRPSSRNKAR